MTTPITPERVRAIIAAYGASPHRWPEAERLRALALVAADPELARLRAEARSFDDLLDAQPPPPTLRVNPAAIAAAAQRARRADAGGRGARPVLMRRAAGMAAAALLGFALGIAGFAPVAQRGGPEDPVAAQIEEDAL